ncbi:3-hydroxyacyl-CoA dehydrogenase family protein [Pararhodobacter oceanensis]|uniref:3-hydroxyacyl-CoA dehydrogenase family protein n=1 Tax=Pararhodobacter oceanensis TaxID=2172121 RepID=UPI003A952550
MPVPDAARAYLSAAQAGCPPASLPASAAIAGGSPLSLGFAAGLALSGAAVVLIEDDTHDARRAQDMLTRAGALKGITITTDPTLANDAPLILAPPPQLASIARHAAPNALLIALTDGMATAATLPQDCVQIFTATPPPQLSVVEMRADPHGPPHALHRTQALLRALGGHPVPVPFFLGPRLIARLEDMAEALVFDGTTPWEVDAAMSARGFDPGPCAAQDLRGLDLAYARHRAEDLDGKPRAVPLIDRMVPEGRLGRQGGVGWYRYPGGGGRVIDPLIEDLAREEAHFARHPLREIGSEEIIRRCLLALLDEAAMLLHEGAPAATIDPICCHATGFPVDEGGPLFAAKRAGFAQVLKQFTALTPSMQPSDALLELAAQAG